MIRDLLTALYRGRPDPRRRRRFVPVPPGTCRLEARLDLVGVALTAPAAIVAAPAPLPPPAPAPAPTGPMPLPPTDPPGPSVPD
jgi:hypothetical protein